MPGEKVEVKISREAYEKARKLAEEAGFSSVEELIEFLIEEAAGVESESAPLSPEEEEKVKQRLRDLGYI